MPDTGVTIRSERHEPPIMSTPTAAAPRYLTRFKCTGPDCPDTCCAGWAVTVDKSHYKKLRNAPDAALARDLREHLHVVPDAGAGQHALMGLRNDGGCQMLDEDRLCRVQKRLGADYLPRTCFDFPRHYFRIGRRDAMYATLGCPEVARLALLAEDGLEPDTAPFPFPPGKPAPYRMGFRGELATHADPVVRNFEAIQTFVQFALRRRDHALWQRLLAIGLAAKRLADPALAPGAADRTAQDRTVELVLLEWQVNLLTGTFLKSTEDLAARPRDALLQQALLKELTAERLADGNGIFGGITSVAFLESIGRAFRGFGYRDNDAEGNAVRFRAAETDWFLPYDRAHPHLLENYLLNQIGARFFPWGFGRGIVHEWNEIMVQYALVRFYLIGLAGEYREQFSGDHYLKLIYSFSRVIEHYPSFREKIFGLLESKGLTSLAAMAIMVKE